MKKIETTACVFLAVFAAIACAGIAVGHDWKLVLAFRDWRKEAHK